MHGTHNYTDKYLMNIILCETVNDKSKRYCYLSKVSFIENTMSYKIMKQSNVPLYSGLEMNLNNLNQNNINTTTN